MSKGSKYQFYMEGEKYQSDFLEAINGAKRSICLQTYIFEMDSFGTKVYEALLEKGKQGLVINLTIDNIGSYYFDKQLKKNLASLENFKITFFNPISIPKILRIGRRLHHKILIIDKISAIIGGINIVDGSNSLLNKNPRLDFAVKIENIAVEKLYDYCLQISQILMKEIEGEVLPEINDSKNKSILFHYNDWFNKRKQITSRYLELINQANKSIYLIHGYFFPSLNIINNLLKIARKGVKVVLILPKYSDWPSWVWASKYLYVKLIMSGIEIREWELSELHGKLAIFDEQIILVGSYNLNYTSSYGNLEMNIEINCHNFVKKIMQVELDYMLKGSGKIRLKMLSDLGWRSKFRNFISYSTLLFVASISINLIKTSRLVKNMKYYEIFFFILLILLGLLGLILPFLPGIPFLIAGIFFLNRRRNESNY